MEPSDLDPDRKKAYLRVHAVNIFVRDQDKSLHFYIEQLGFTLAFDVVLQSGERWVGVSPPDGTAVLTLIAPEADSDAFKLIGQTTSLVFVTEDVVATYTEWRRRGVRFRHTPRLRRVKPRAGGEAAAAASPSVLLGKQKTVWGGVFTRFEDIDHNSFALVSFDEMTEAMEQQRRAAEEKLEAERRSAHELAIAKQVQARLFPQTLPELKTLDYAGACIQARQVGGDYYDFLNLGRDRVGLVLGDIAGKGIAGALLMANLQANLRGQCAIAWNEPQRLLRSVNELFFDNTSDSAYATLIFAEYDDLTQTLRYANCGHLSALLLRADGTVARLGSTCTVLGLFREWECAVQECQLGAGDLLALFTDGVTECFNTAGEEFGEERLLAALRQHQGRRAQQVLASVVDQLQAFSTCEQYDDITLIVARCGEPEQRAFEYPA